MALERMASFSIFCFRMSSSLLSWGNHWKGVMGLGMKQEVDTVMRTPRLRLGVETRQTW